MELPSPLISWVNPFPSRVINKTIFFCNALESHECACCLLSFLYFHWLFPLLARETSSGNRSIYKSTREMVDSKGLCARWRLHLMGSWFVSIWIKYMFTAVCCVFSPNFDQEIDHFGGFVIVNNNIEGKITECWLVNEESIFFLIFLRGRAKLLAHDWSSGRVGERKKLASKFRRVRERCPRSTIVAVSVKHSEIQ